MGIYAQTHFEIECQNAKTAKAVLKKLKSLKMDKNGNTFGTELTQNNEYVSGFENSGRIQNLEYRLDKIWEAIKKIKGIVRISAPFLSEADGFYQEIETT